MNGILEVTIGRDKSKTPELVILNADSITKKLSNEGHLCLLIQGGLVEATGGAILLFVDDGIKRLYVDYQELERLATEEKNYFHGSFINDGLLVISANINNETASIKLEYCPSLNVENLQVFYLEISSADYLSWWRSMMKAFVQLGET